MKEINTAQAARHDSVAFKHYILTMFNVEAVFSRGTFLQREWLDHRFDLFAKYCLPSIARQTCSNFTWVVLMDERTPIQYQERLRHLLSKSVERHSVLLTGPKWPHMMRLFIQGNLPYETTHVITTRIDNDDAMHKDLILSVQRHFDRQDYTFVEFVNGYSYDARNSTLRRSKYVGNPFVSLIEKFRQDITTVFCGDHLKLREKGPFITIPEPPAWIHVIHDRNAINEHFGTLVFRGATRILNEDFGFDTTWPERTKRLLITVFLFLSCRVSVWPRPKLK